MNSINQETDLMIAKQFFEIDDDIVYDCEHFSNLKNYEDSCTARLILTKGELPDICPDCNEPLSYNFDRTRKVSYEKFKNSYLEIKKKKISPKDRLICEQLALIVKKENKTIEEMRLELNLSIYLDERDLCFTDL